MLAIHSFLDRFSDPIIIFSSVNGIQSINQAFSTHLGYAFDDVANKPIQTLFAQVSTLSLTALNEPRLILVTTKLGAILPVILTILPDDAARNAYIAVLLVESNTDNIESALQMQQSRISLQLHDGLGQSLTYLGLLAENLSHRVGNTDADVDLVLEKLIAGIHHIHLEIRSLARGITTHDFLPNSLDRNLKQLADELKIGGIHCHLQTLGTITVPSSQLATDLYRI
jgi:signal transduction histidine kinase